MGSLLVVAMVAADPDGVRRAGAQQMEDASHRAAGRHLDEKATTPPGAGTGMIIHIDPQTGAVLKAPAPGSVGLHLTPNVANALSTSDQGLVEAPASAPAKGIRMDLQGRFRSPLLATTDANGQLKIQHLHETPDSTTGR